jgi:hypothetical protein
MPAITLVLCVCRERELLERLLRQSAGCYDDLVVVHDGPDRAGVRALVESAGGRFFERPRAYQQEPHWPFAWGQARNDWILRLDADEYPSPELKQWLTAFRTSPGPGDAVSGYTCIWPLWNGRRAVTTHWPGGRNFLFDRRRVSFFGMVEAVPIPDAGFEPINLVLQHEPLRKSYGVRNILFRKQAYHWRRVIAESLQDSPVKLPCWRWNSLDWPPNWEELRRWPLRCALDRLFRYPVHQVRAMLRAGEFPRPSACLNPGIHHFMLGLRVCLENRRRRSAE